MADLGDRYFSSLLGEGAAIPRGGGKHTADLSRLVSDNDLKANTLLGLRAEVSLRRGHLASQQMSLAVDICCGRRASSSNDSPVCWLTLPTPSASAQPGHLSPRWGEVQKVSAFTRGKPLDISAGYVSTLARPVSDSPLLVNVGGYAHTKGQHDLVKGLPSLLHRFPRLRCQLIGEVRDDSYLRYLRSLAHDLRVSDRLSITPDLSHADKQAALEGADVYVQPSHEEGFCLAYAEAAAVVPRLVGTDTGAIAAISQNDTGARVVGVRDPDAIAAAVRELLETALPIDHMAQRAARLSAQFSQAAYLQAHEKVYAGHSR